MDAIQTTPSSISDPSYQKVIISLVQFEQDFNTHTQKSQIGWVGDRLPPPRPIPRSPVTVITNTLWANLLFCSFLGSTVQELFPDVKHRARGHICMWYDNVAEKKDATVKTRFTLNIRCIVSTLYILVSELAENSLP